MKKLFYIFQDYNYTYGLHFCKRFSLIKMTVVVGCKIFFCTYSKLSQLQNVLDHRTGNYLVIPYKVKYTID